MILPSAFNRTYFFIAAALVAVMFALPIPGLAQGGNQGIIEGFVVDSSGAVIPNAGVTVTDAARGTQYTAATDNGGRFIFPILPSGTYSVKIAAPGFAASVTNNVIVAVGAKIDLSIALRVESASQQVTVNTDVPVVETTRTTVAESVNARQVADLPINGRNFLDFTLLTPGVVRDIRGGDLSFGGQRGTLNSLTIDGTDNNNSFFGQSLRRAPSRS